MRLLIPGGAGYNGSHMVKYAQEHGYEDVLLDDFPTNFKGALDENFILKCKKSK